VTDISITEDGRFVALGFVNSYVYFTDKNGNVQWKQTMSGPVEAVKVTPDGSLVFAVTSDKAIWILNKNGNLLLNKKFEGVPNSVATTMDGDYFVTGSMNTVYFFAIARYLEYIVREQAKMVRMMKEGGARGNSMVDKDGKLNLNMKDDIINGTTAVHGKEFVSQRVKQMLNI
jgi:WD40 repeat protein